MNYTEWGFGFQLWHPTSTFFALPFAVTEPSNGTFHGAIQCTGPCEFGSAGVFACYYQGGLLTSCNPVENESSPAWFTPDHEAGVVFSVVSPMPPNNLTLLVET